MGSGSKFSGLRRPTNAPGPRSFIHFFEDETFWHASANRDLVEDSPTEIMEARFEGTTAFVRNSKAICGDDRRVGVADLTSHL